MLERLLEGQLCSSKVNASALMENFNPLVPPVFHDPPPINSQNEQREFENFTHLTEAYLTYFRSTQIRNGDHHPSNSATRPATKSYTTTTLSCVNLRSACALDLI